MVLPKYKFYIAKGLNASILRGYVINNSTGEISMSSDEHSISELIDISEYNDIWLLTPYIYTNCSIAQYDENDNFLGISDYITKSGPLSFSQSVKKIRLRFYILLNTISNTSSIIVNRHLVIPHYKELNKKYAKENGQQFFRTTLDGKITVFGRDFEFVYNSNLEDNLLFFIDKYHISENRWLEYYKGEFSKTDCKFNFDKKSCELKLSTLDEYSNIMNRYDNTYDLIKLAPAISSINMCKRMLLQIYVLGANTVSNFLGGTYWETDTNEIINSTKDLEEKYHFAYVKSANEFYIRNSNVDEINGVYAGVNNFWQNQNGFSVYAEQYDSDSGYLFIQRNSDNKVYYVSNLIRMVFDTNNIYIPSAANIVFSALEGNGIASGTCDFYSMFTYHIYQRILCNISTITDTEGEKQTYDLPADDFVSDNRSYKKCIGIKKGIVICTSYTVDTPTKYGMNDYGQYFTNDILYNSVGTKGQPLPISRNSWVNSSLWYVYSSWYDSIEEQTRYKYTLKDSYFIADVIKAMLKEIDPSITHEATSEYSKFLYDTTPPIGLDKFYVCIAPKSNVLKGNYDQAAQKAEISFEDLMNMLRDCFRCYWYIENNKLKIEHIAFFMNGGSYIKSNTNVQLDFISLKDAFNKKNISYFQTEIEYDKEDLSSRYEFAWMDNTTDLFAGVYIDVKSNYVQKDKLEEISVNQFSSDIDYMLAYPSEFSSDGFALLCPIKNNSIYELPIVSMQIKDENGKTYDVSAQNGYASWLYLIRYYMYDMPSKNIKCNMKDLYVGDIKRSMQHSIEFKSEEDPNTIGLIKTDFGYGSINEVSINIDTRATTVSLLYEPV